MAMINRYGPVIALVVMVASASTALAQPTFKLSVKPDLQPLASLKFDGARISRSAVADDPGFRLQYHIRKDGKTVSVVDARASTTIELPLKEAGAYMVTLELFYPDYKGGNAQKGAFKPISNMLWYLAYKDMAGQLQIADLGVLRNHLFYGLTAGKLIPVPE
jgi:hypothetical protein